MKLRGQKEVLLAVENRLEASSARAKQVLEEYAGLIAELASYKAPRDTGALEGAIRVKPIKRSGLSGRTTYHVYVKGSVLNKNGRNVGFYASRMHEGGYNPGPGSVTKQAALQAMFPGQTVGEGYLADAYQFYHDDLIAELKIRVAEEVERRAARLAGARRIARQTKRALRRSR